MLRVVSHLLSPKASSLNRCWARRLLRASVLARTLNRLNVDSDAADALALEPEPSTDPFQMASSIGLALRQALLLLLHALDLLLSAVARLFARRPAFSASRTKPPPHHVELLLVDDDPQSTMASVQLAVNWARDQGVSDLSVFVPKGELSIGLLASGACDLT